MNLKKKLSIITCVSLSLGSSVEAALVQEAKTQLHDNVIKETGRLVLESLEKDLENFKKNGLRISDVHVKQHACLRAVFKVSNDINEKFRFGVFEEPGKEFATWMRYSNGSPKVEADYTKGGRGLAIKLMGVEGERVLENDSSKTQDFLLANNPVFFVKNILDYPSFFQAVNSGSLCQVLTYFFPWRWHEGMNFMRGRTVIRNPLEAIYYSQMAYRLSDANNITDYKTVKYSVRPAPHVSQTLVSGDPKSPNLLREAAVATLKAQDVVLEFGVQERTDPASMPTDDASIEWDEKISPFQKVAEIRIPRQNFDTPETDKRCQEMYFNPANGIHQHQPLGPMGWVRSHVYREVAEFRRVQMGYQYEEPTPENSGFILNSDGFALIHPLDNQAIETQ